MFFGIISIRVVHTRYVIFVTGEKVNMLLIVGCYSTTNKQEYYRKAVGGISSVATREGAPENAGRIPARAQRFF